MNPPTDIATPPAGLAAHAPACPQCGSPLASGMLAGMCPNCFARSALDDDTGWLSGDLRPDTSLPGPEDDLPVIKGWKITGTLGAGGMGRVYHAESVADGTPVAVKVLDARWSRNPVAMARIEAEAAALKLLQHPHIIQILDTTAAEDGRFCLVMEFVEGCDLGRLLRAQKLSLAQAMDIFAKVCAAVAHAHACGIAHRDIKPANILTAHDGTVKLVDFGLAKDLATEGGAETMIGALTATTDHFGSAYYLAPERFLSGRASGTAGDIYALGVLLYHLLAGRMPLGNYTPLSKLAGLPGEIDKIVAGALEADAEKRTHTVEELQRAVLEVWRKHLAGAGRARMRRGLLVCAAALLGAASLAAAGAVWQRQRMQAPAAFMAPESATGEKPWVNSLGMKFVPVPGTKVLFCIWETRRQDAEAYMAAARGLLTSSWRKDLAERFGKENNKFYILDENRRLSPVGSWEDSGFPVTPLHPATFITVREAQRYCLWLTWKEQGEGRIKPGQIYRLPTSAEWLAACGGADAPLRPGNVAGPEARDDRWPRIWPTLERRDPFPRTAPAGSFPPELFGLHDISGNVTEWVLDEAEDAADPLKESAAQLRGPAFHDGTVQTASFGYLHKVLHNMRLPNVGFRVVLDYQDENGGKEK